MLIPLVQRRFVPIKIYMRAHAYAAVKPLQDPHAYLQFSKDGVEFSRCSANFVDEHGQLLRRLSFAQVSEGGAYHSRFYRYNDKRTNRHLNDFKSHVKVLDLLEVDKRLNQENKSTIGMLNFVRRIPDGHDVPAPPKIKNVECQSNDNMYTFQFEYDKPYASEPLTVAQLKEIHNKLLDDGHLPNYVEFPTIHGWFSCFFMKNKFDQNKQNIFWWFEEVRSANDGWFGQKSSENVPNFLTIQVFGFHPTQEQNESIPTHDNTGEKPTSSFFSLSFKSWFRSLTSWLWLWSLTKNQPPKKKNINHSRYVAYTMSNAKANNLKTQKLRESYHNTCN